MSELTHTCAACGAEESLDSLLARMLDDDDVRRMVYDVVTVSLPLGALVARYLRLFKPAKQKLRMATIHKVLAELLPDIQRAAIERNGRVWPAGPAAWRAALEAVFVANEKGTLAVPLQGNGYLYQVLMRLADRTEAEHERQVDEERRHRASVTHATPAAAPAAPAVPQVAIDRTPRPRTESPLVRRMKAQLAASRGEHDTPVSSSERTQE